MEKVKFSVTVNKETKEEAEKIFKTIGLDLSTAINIYLKKVVDVEGIPFRLCSKNFQISKTIDEEGK